MPDDEQLRASPQPGAATAITPKSEDFARWYIDVVRRAELADYTPVRGCMVIRPYGFGLWENTQALLDARLKASGHQNAYFPLLIPESLLQKEAEHVEGFAPEVAWVTHGGADELEERLAVRPTSEAIICSLYAKWVRSWRDLPLLINQWANVLRWEKVTRFFLRTTEFLWQEGHTVHATEKEAEEETLRILDIYRAFLEEDLAIPVVAGLKSDKDKFAGALRTYTIEALMSDGRALQAGTSHNLGQNFSKAFGIRFEDADQQLRYAWTTSWGVSTRLIGALIMAHGDDQGLMLPPRIAPYQVVIVPIPGRHYAESVLPAARSLQELLSATGLRAHLDDREEYTPGWKYNEWELRGVPLRAEVGPRDVTKGQAVLVRRDNREKSFVPLDRIPAEATGLLDAVQGGLLERARRFLQENTRPADDYETFQQIMSGSRGFIEARWCGNRDCEEAIQQDTAATLRCLPLEQGPPTGTCVRCDEPAQHQAVFAKAY
ncbi:MAG: proline--tRNA ligase [Acidobacteriota bacterium]